MCNREDSAVQYPDSPFTSSVSQVDAGAFAMTRLGVGPRLATEQRPQQPLWMLSSASLLGGLQR